MRPFCTPRLVGIISLAAALSLSLNSCIYEAPGDKFYRTLWNTTRLSPGTSGSESLTLEFLCGGQVTIRDGSGIIIAHGTYTPDGSIATFDEMSAVINEITVTFLEAHRNGDTLFLLWIPEGQQYPSTTAMERRSSYD